MAEAQWKETDFVYKTDDAKVQSLMESFDPEMRFRALKGLAARIVLIMCLILSIFHIYTAGFGVLQEWKHRCFHFTFVLSLVLLVFPTRKVKVGNLTTTWVYEILFSLMSGTILALTFQNIFKLSAPIAWVIFAVGFFMAFAMKTRDLWGPKVVPRLDLASSTIGLVGFFYAAFIIVRYWGDYLGESGTGFAVWTFVMLAAIGAPLAYMFYDSLRILGGKKSFVYDPQKIPYFEMTMAAMGFALSSYLIMDFDQFIYRAGFPNLRDYVLGSFGLVLVLEATRRSLGVPLAIMGFLALAICYLGPYLANVPVLSFFSHRGYSPSRIVDQMYLGTEGLYGVPLGVVATFVFHFVLFGIFTMKTGLGKFFIDLAMAVAGWSAGGPAKVSVVSSALLGTISGSSVANTVTDGVFTIPMMKRLGFSKEFAGAVEAATSTGGQIMPPIMGAAAFIMAEFLGIPYLTICLAAITPAIFYFTSLWVQIHFEARKLGMKGIPRDQLPKIKQLLKENGILVLPLIVIVWLLMSGFTPFLAAFWGIISSVAFTQTGPKTKNFFVAVCSGVPCVLFQWNPFEGPVVLTLLWAAYTLGGLIYTYRISKFIHWIWGTIAIVILILLVRTGLDPHVAAFWPNLFVIVTGLIIGDGRMRIQEVLDCLEWGTKNALAIGAACAAVGFIVGTTTLTGLGLKFASGTVDLASGTAAWVQTIDLLQWFTLKEITLVALLAYTAIASLILGMGLPTTPNYIVVSIIAAPALLKFGIVPLVSHMFVFYYGILADLTPPVAVAAYAAAGISGGDPFKTGVRSFLLALTSCYVPFAIIFNPELVLMPWILSKTAMAFPYIDYVHAAITTFLGVVALGALIVGYFGDRARVAERFFLLFILWLVWRHDYYSTIIGAVLLVGLYFYQRQRRIKRDGPYNKKPQEAVAA
jgi:TRAP-type uncharacterized transport system fused permease subunit